MAKSIFTRDTEETREDLDRDETLKFIKYYYKIYDKFMTRSCIIELMLRKAVVTRRMPIGYNVFTGYEYHDQTFVDKTIANDVKDNMKSLSDCYSKFQMGLIDAFKDAGKEYSTFKKSFDAATKNVSFYLKIDNSKIVEDKIDDCQDSDINTACKMLLKQLNKITSRDSSLLAVDVKELNKEDYNSTKHALDIIVESEHDDDSVKFFEKSISEYAKDKGFHLNGVCPIALYLAYGINIEFMDRIRMLSQKISDKLGGK